MTQDRIDELHELAVSAIEDSRLVGRYFSDNTSLSYWQGVKSVVDELKLELGSSCNPGELKL